MRRAELGALWKRAASLPGPEASAELRQPLARALEATGREVLARFYPEAPALLGKAPPGKAPP
jgi:hypothetical protein